MNVLFWIGLFLIVDGLRRLFMGLNDMAPLSGKIQFIGGIAVIIFFLILIGAHYVAQ